MRALVVGLGNPFRGDDAAGIEVARRIRDDGPPPGVEVRPNAGDPLGLLDLWGGADVVYLVDAVAGSGPAGTVHRHEAGAGRLPDHPRRDSTHVVGLGDAIELARVLGRLPRKLVVVGIEGADFRAGSKLSPAVADAVKEVAATLAREAASIGAEGGGP